MVEDTQVVDAEVVKNLLKDHRPGVCSNMHMICTGCHWHESYTGNPMDLEPEDIGNWWDEYLTHLTTVNKKEVIQ